MFALIRDGGNELADAVLLAAGKDKLRMILRGRNGRKDTTELRRAGENWLLENGRPVEIEALLTDVDVSAFCSDLFPIVRGAGGQMAR